MIQLPASASDDDILNAIRDWIEVLAEDNFEAGYAMLRHSPDEPWTPEFLRIWISNYGWHDPMKDGSTFQVTSWETATRTPSSPQKQYTAVEHYSLPAVNGAMGYVHFDLPLNGSWSDLTAIFSFFNVEGFIVLQLDDVHVL